MDRVHLSLDADLLAKAKLRAAELGISLPGYVSHLVAEDLAQPHRTTDASAVFDLGDSGGSDIAQEKDRYMAEAITTLDR